MTTETLAAGDRRWDELVDGAPTPDVYFRPGYGLAYQASGEGRLVCVRTEGALFPLLLRELPFGANGLDAVTPYGYGGLLPLGAEPDFASELRQLRDWCTTEGVASALVRLHPLLGGPGDLSQTDDIAIREHGPTASIDLSRIEEGRLAGMSKGRKADLSVARRELAVSWEQGDEALERFRAVYDETMARIGASGTYFFPAGYYSALADGLADGLGIALAVRGDEIVGGSLFLADPKGPFAHYHLSGTTDAGRELKAGTLLVHEGAVWAAARGAARLHLGGGTSGADGLYAFKHSFGGEEHTYRFATVVADRETYDGLVARRAEEPEPLRPEFFPAYRA